MDSINKDIKTKNEIASTPGGPGLSWNKLNFVTPASHSAKFWKVGIVVGSVLVVLALAAWGGLLIYQRVLYNNIQSVKDKQASLFTDQEKQLANNIIEIENRASLIQTFLKSHIYTSETLNLLADSTLPRVKWDSYSLSVKDNSVTLKGKAASYSDLAKQLKSFEEGTFSNLVISGINLDKSGTITFSINFKFDPKILQKS